MSVRNDDCIQPGNSALPQVGRHNVFSEIEVRVLAAEWTCGVDQKQLALWGNQKRGVGLAYVDGGNLKNSGAELSLRHDCAKPETSTNEQRDSGGR
jgi:hypothetical protein